MEDVESIHVSADIVTSGEIEGVREVVALYNEQRSESTILLIELLL